LNLESGAIGEINAQVLAPRDKGSEILSLNTVAVVEESSPESRSLPIRLRAACVLAALKFAHIANVTLFTACLLKPLLVLSAIAANRVTESSTHDMGLGAPGDGLTLGALRVFPHFARVVRGATLGLLVLASLAIGARSVDRVSEAVLETCLKLEVPTLKGRAVGARSVSAVVKCFALLALRRDVLHLLAARALGALCVRELFTDGRYPLVWRALGALFTNSIRALHEVVIVNFVERRRAQICSS
jgi:hypothetical protein